VGAGLGDDKPDDLPIEDLHLSMRAHNCLRRSGLLTVGQILSRREGEIRSLRNFGMKSFDELRDKFDELGILPRDAAWNS
jgi:DNA-directed RNA polymerase subunit alpha